MNLKFKFIIIIIWILVVTTNLISKEIIIRKVKVIGNTYTDKEIILLIAGIKQGDKIEEDELDSYIQKAKQRLEITTYFFYVGVYVIPPLKYPQYRTIVIEVKEGFLYRFGGGPIYVLFGYENFNGKADSIYLYAGYNIQRIIFINKFLFNSYWYYKIDLKHTLENYEVLGANKELDISLFSLNFQPGYMLTPDFKIFLISKFNYYLVDDDIYKFPISGCGAEYNTGNSFLSPTAGWYINFEYLYYINKNFYSITGKIVKYISLAKIFTFAMLIQASTIQGNSPYFLLHRAKQIRTKLYSELEGKNLYLGSIELRVPLKKFILFGMVDSILKGVLFIDYGRGFNNTEIKILEKGEFVYGAGIRLLLKMPVYLPVRLEYGYNEKNNGMIFFSTEKPF